MPESRPSLFNRITRWASPSDLWSLFQILFPAVSGTVVSWLTQIAGLPLYFTIGWGLMVTAAAFVIARMLQETIVQNSVFRQLTANGIGMQDYEVDIYVPNEQNYFLCQLTPTITLLNHSERTIFYRFKAGHFSMLGKINPNAFVQKDIHSIPKRGSGVTVSLPTIHDLQLPRHAPSGSVHGKVDFQIEYGPKEDNLKYLLEYEGKPMLGLRISQAPLKAELLIATEITHHHHERLRWL
jgi:hypothetical protein